MSKYMIVLLILLFGKVGYGQDNDSIVIDTFYVSHSGYTATYKFGSPYTLEIQLLDGDRKKNSLINLSGKLLAPWYKAKKFINEKARIQYGINYALYYVGASASIEPNGQQNAGSGIFDIPISWKAWGNKSGNIGSFGIKFETRHLIGSGVSPQMLGFQTGSILLPATKANTFTFRIMEFYFQQVFFKGRATILIGKLDPTNYFNYYSLINPHTNFFGYGFSVAPTTDWPNQGLGITAAVMLNKNKNLYLSGGVFDVHGDTYDNNNLLNAGTQFYQGNLNYMAEFGYTPNYDERYDKRISVSYWYSDPTETSAQGMGLAFSATWKFAKFVYPAVRAGYSSGTGNNVLARTYVAVSNGFTFRENDVLNVGFNWADPVGLRDQFTFEVYYRFYLLDQLAITPDFQWVIRPSLNLNVNQMVYWGLRARISL